MRPMEISPETVSTILESLASGTALKTICDQPGMPSRSAVYRLRGKDPEFRTRLQTAQEAHADALMDDLVPIADEVPDAQRARNMIQARQARAASIKPKEYGARVDLNITQTVDYRAAHLAGQERLRLMRDQSPELVPTIIDGTTTYIVKPTDGQSVTAPDEAVDPFS